MRSLLMLPFATLLLAAADAGSPSGTPDPVAQVITQRIEAARADNQKWLLEGSNSYFAAIQRVDFGDRKSLVVGSAEDADVRIADPDVLPHHLRITVDGGQFVVAGLVPTAKFKRGQVDVNDTRMGPGAFGLGRYTLRLSHQGFPAVIVFDPKSPRFKDAAPLRYFPVDLRYRFTLPLIPNPKPETVTIQSTRGHRREAQKVGWFEFTIDGKKARLEATRLLEPGANENAISLFFRDATTGKESYPVGRYLEPELQPDGRYVVDFNLAYNPACAYSPHYNCPIPPKENKLSVAIRAGEMAPAGKH